MKFELKEIKQLTGKLCKIYSVQMEGDENTLFEQFLDENEEIGRASCRERVCLAV